MRGLFVPAILLQICAPLHAQQEQPNPVETRLRDSLRTTTQQLRTAESERATLQATLAERDAALKTLEAQVAALVKRANDDKAETDRAISGLKENLSRQEKESARLSGTLAQWKTAYNKAVSALQSTETQRAKLDTAKIILERRVATLETQNLELYKIGSEVLERYEKFGFGKALLAREPFTGIAKVKLEEQIQDYRDKLQDSKIKPADASSAPAEKPVPPTTPPKKP